MSFDMHHSRLCKPTKLKSMKSGGEMKNGKNRTWAAVSLKLAVCVKQSKCRMHAVVMTFKGDAEFRRVQRECPNSFNKYVVLTDIAVKLCGFAIKPILIEPQDTDVWQQPLLSSVMSWQELQFPVWDSYSHSGSVCRLETRLHDWSCKYHVNGD